MNKQPRKGIPFIILRCILPTVFYILSTIGSSILLSYVQEYLPPLLVNWVSAGLTLGLLWFLLWLYLRFAERRSFKDIGMPFKKRNVLHIFPGLLFGIALILLSAIPLYATGNYTISFAEPNLLALAGGIPLFIMVGFCEEMITRGAMQHGLLRLSPLPAVIITSALFSAMHLMNPNLAVLPMINLFLAGMVMGMLVYATGDIWASIGMHITWNWLQGSVLGINVSGQDFGGLFSTKIVGSNEIITGGEFGIEGSIICTIVMVISIVLLFVLSKRNWNYDYYAKDLRQKAL